MALTIQKRWEIIFLSSHPKGPHMSKYQIAKYMHISEHTVSKWISRYQETGDIMDQEGRGRKKKTSTKIDKAIITLFEKDERMTLKEAQRRLNRKGIELSIPTISKRLHEFGFVNQSPLKKPLLSSSHMKKRVQWCDQVQDVDWNYVIFSDESTFTLKGYNRKYWHKRGSRKVLRVIKHAPKIHVWGCFSSSGFGKLILFTKNLDTEKMISIYENGLLLSAEQFGFDDTSEWWLQEDNDPKHMSNGSKNWKTENNIQRLDWPSYSPDLAPIENLWSYMKLKVDENKPRTLNDLVKNIKKVWSTLSPELARNLSNSMSNRILQCIKSNGDYIMY
jgi:transposase